MAEYPESRSQPWGTKLRDYIDEADANNNAAAAAAAQADADAAQTAAAAAQAEAEGRATSSHNHDSAYLAQSADITSIVKITQAAYDALSPKIATRLYVIVG